MKSTASQIAQDLAELRSFFLSNGTKSLSSRRQVLVQLKKMLEDNEQVLKEAVYLDLHKNPIETKLTEIMMLLMEIQEHLDYFEEWAQPERVGTNISNQPGASYIYKEPLGVVCIIGAWNFPIQLLLLPLIGCISAGNCAILRLPGDDTCVHTIKILRDLIETYMDPNWIRVVSGGIEETQLMLQQRYDLIFCTGGTLIGKIVSRAAAEHLTPVILELGGKSPTFVDEEIDMETCTRRIAWGAFLNCGQICLRPDYILVNSKIGDQFVQALQNQLTNFFGENPKTSDSYGRIINDRAYQRLVKTLDKDKAFALEECQVDPQERYIAPTILNFNEDFEAFSQSASMQQENFGPVLPIVYYDEVDKMIDYVKTQHEKPLALYIYSTNKKFQEKILWSTSSGGCVVNDSICHVSNSSLPFGGVGHSGMGSYHGKFSFDAFSHKKSVLFKTFWLDIKVRFMPFTPFNERFAVFFLHPFWVSKTFKRCLHTLGLMAFIGFFKWINKNNKTLSTWMMNKLLTQTKK